MLDKDKVLNWIKQTIADNDTEMVNAKTDPLINKRLYEDMDKARDFTNNVLDALTRNIEAGNFNAKV